jgi:hypothetical protein
MTATPPRPPFRVSGTATIKHLNVRKEGPDDQKVLAVDVKLEVSNVDMLICRYFDDALVSFFWRTEGLMLAVRNEHLQPVGYANEIESAHVTINGMEFVGCDIKKFAITPHDGGTVTLGCSVSFQPTSDDVALLAKSVQDDVQIHMEGPPDLFDGDQGAKAAGAKLDETLRQDGLKATVIDNAGNTLATFGDGPDPLLDQARALVLKEKRASISTVQRHLQIGYNRAARLLEALEGEGVVSAMDSAGRRQIRTTEGAPS